MTHTDLELFLNVLSRKNLSEVAAESSVSQPRATQMLQRLEREIGCPLFVRSHAGLEPTEAAHEFASFAEQILSARRNGIRAAQEAATEVVGSLHVGVSHTPSVFTVPSIIRDFHRAYPNVRLKLTRTFPAQLLQGMQSDYFDVCLCFKPARVAPFTWQTLFSTDLVGIYAPSFEETVKSDFKSFCRLPLVLPSQRCSYRLLIDTELQKLGIVPSIVMEIDDAKSLVSMVRHGTGVSIVPRVIARSAGQIKVTNLERPRIFAEAGISTKKNPTKAVSAFVAMVFSEIAARNEVSVVSSGDNGSKGGI